MWVVYNRANGTEIKCFDNSVDAVVYAQGHYELDVKEEEQIMATEYGVQFRTGETGYWNYDRSKPEAIAKAWNFALVAREVSEPRIVSIRA